MAIFYELNAIENDGMTLITFIKKSTDVFAVNIVTSMRISMSDLKSGH